MNEIRQMIIDKRKGESYQHAAARTVFAEWLKSSSGSFGPFIWSGEVWEEYPFIEGYCNQVLSEIAPDICMANAPIPTYEELAANNIYPIAIADIAVSHKGSIYYVIEIVHKHDISNEKIKLLEKHVTAWGVEIWRVEAHWVLSQVGKPTSFPEDCIRPVGKNVPSEAYYGGAFDDAYLIKMYDIAVANCERARKLGLTPFGTPLIVGNTEQKD